MPLTSRNARIVCELAGRPDVPVYAGADRPLVRPLITAEYVHGRTGLDGADLPEPTMPLQAEHAADFLVRVLRESPPGTITLCPLGPLTNVALALQRAPEVAGRIREIVLMGGGFSEGGNTTPAAEFNIYVDPQAADLVFSQRGAADHAAPRRHPPGPDQAAPPGAPARPSGPGWGRRWPGGSSSSSATTWRSTAWRAARSTTPA